MYKNIKKSFFLSNIKKNIIYFFLSILLMIIISLTVYKIFIYRQKNQIKTDFLYILNDIKKNKFHSSKYVKSFFQKNKNIYGVFTGLNLAKLYDSKKKYDCALHVLFNILKFIKDNNLKDLIKLRISILYIKNNNISLAKKMQSSINQITWKKILNTYSYVS
ncbi:tetratricopeptide repeat protein [Buchnera aphidicola]|uniref:tetratricopeptide repeat protein n=1 Tax=Buchnera aphidicola TaxID=9 RepID=UPI00094D10DC|nr:tetratricopeptide repeat protein [Buchnera aphidicola]